MKSNIKSLLVTSALVAASTCAHSMNLLINGGFEYPSDFWTTPEGWTNIGHMDGVIGYGDFGVPNYEGHGFYDLGGYGNPYGPIGDGIAQSFATTIGSTYVVTFGLSAENLSGSETLRVSVGGVSIDYVLIPDGSGVWRRPFMPQVFEFVAIEDVSTLSFIHSSGAQSGSNDPLIDGVVVFEGLISAVPEPSTYALMLAGLGAVGAAVRRRKA